MTYPLCLYRAGSTFDWDGRPTDQREAADADEHERLAGEGWAVAADYLGTSLAAAEQAQQADTSNSDLAAATELLDEERKAREAAEKATLEAQVALETERSQAEELRGQVATLFAENEGLKAQIDAFDQAGDGKAGGGKKTDK